MPGVIILAAGASTRLGKPKQLLQFNDKTLLQHAIDNAIAVNGNPVIVVLGSSAEIIEAEIKRNPVKIVINQNWQEGMSSSIRAGLTTMVNLNPEAEDVILLLADQPFVTPSLLTQLTEAKYASGKGIVACTYKDQPGVPALFDQQFLSALLSLKGTEGAKKLFFEFEESVAYVPFPLGSIDIDTLEDYDNLLKSERRSGKDYFNSWC